MNTLYLTPSETRRYAVELPVGDPYSGPAYGKKTMPVVAVAAAAASFVSGAAAFTAATSMVSMIAAGATMVGSALTIIGTVTKNPKLTKIGGILAIGGMVGTALSGAASGAAAGSGEVAGATGGATDAAMSLTEGGAINEAAHFSDAAFDAGLPGAASAAPEAAQIAGNGGGLIDMQPGLQAGRMTDVQSQSFLDAANKSQAQTIGADATNPMVAQAQNTMSTAGTEVGKSLNTDAFANESAKLLRQNNATSGGLLNTDIPTANLEDGYFDKFGRWVKNNKEMASIAANVGAGMLKNLVPSEQEKAQTEYYRQQAELAKRRALYATGRMK